MRVDLAGRVAMVLGGAEGLGETVAALLRDNGARVSDGPDIDMLVNFHAGTAEGAGHSQAAAAAMATRGGGRIVQIADVAGLVPSRGQVDAAAAAVFARTRVMALDHARAGVLVNAIATLGRVTPDTLSHIPSGRVATAAEIGNAILFLLAPASSYITGHILTIDGAWSAGFARDF